MVFRAATLLREVFPVVGDVFAERLRAARRERGLSLAGLAALAHYSKGHLSKVENGEKTASPELAAACDTALHAEGELAALADPRRLHRPARPSEPPEWSADGDGIGHEPSAPPRLSYDQSTVELFAAMLDSHRGLGHHTSPRDVLDGLRAHLRTVRAMAAAAAEPAMRTELWLLAARYADYAGWMAQEAGDETQAAALTDLAARCAGLAGDTDLACFATVRTAELALYRGDAARTVRLTAPIVNDPRVAAGVRAIAAERQAQGFALAGYEQQCRAALDRAAELHGQVGAGRRFGTRSLPDPVAIATGWALNDLRRPVEAAAQLDRGIAGIPASATRSRARFAVRRAVVHAENGDIEHACALVAAVLADVRLVDSATIRLDLTRLSRAMRPSGLVVARELRAEIGDILFPARPDH